MTTIKSTIRITLTLAITFGLGFAFKTITLHQTKNKTTMKKITGIAGNFFKCKDPKIMTEWYKNHLGLNTNAYGATF